MDGFESRIDDFDPLLLGTTFNLYFDHRLDR